MQPIIKAIGLHKSFNGQKVLNGFTMSVRKGQVVANGKPLDDYMAGMKQSDTSGVSVADREVFEFEPGAVKDEQGYFYKPNAAAPGGKQYLRDQRTGKKIRSKSFN